MTDPTRNQPIEKLYRYLLWERSSERVIQGIRSLVKFGEDRGRTFDFANMVMKPRFLFEGDDLREWTTCGSLPQIEETLKVAVGAGRNLLAWEMMILFPPIGARPDNDQMYAYIDVAPRSDVLVTVRAENINLFEDFKREIESLFGFSGLPVIPKDLRIEASPQPTALIGCHFDDEGKHAARTLALFLGLLRFARVEIADSFRSDSVPEKIKSAIERNDLYFAVVTGKRDHSWITAETSYAIARRKFVVLTVQDGCNFNPTLAGADRERLPFSKKIEETFIGVLQEIRRLGVVGV